MAAPATGYRHIAISASGVPLIAGTGYKVVPLLEHYKARGWTVEEFQQHYPDLTPAQLHSVLAYYYDHADELDGDIQRRTHLVDETRRQTALPPVVDHLRALRRWAACS